jgi:hypothetical protein
MVRSERDGWSVHDRPRQNRRTEMGYDEAAFLEALRSVDTAPEPRTREDLCALYKRVKPILEGILPFIELIPIWGKGAAKAIRLLMRGLDVLCP